MAARMKTRLPWLALPAVLAVGCGPGPAGEDGGPPSAADTYPDNEGFDYAQCPGGHPFFPGECDGGVACLSSEWTLAKIDEFWTLVGEIEVHTEFGRFSAVC